MTNEIEKSSDTRGNQQNDQKLKIIIPNDHITLTGHMNEDD